MEPTEVNQNCETSTGAAHGCIRGFRLLIGIQMDFSRVQNRPFKGLSAVFTMFASKKQDSALNKV